MTHPNKREVHAKAMEFQQKRKECNEVILKKLTEYLRNNSNMRFNQALYNLNIVSEQDSYYHEPMDVLKRMK